MTPSLSPSPHESAHCGPGGCCGGRTFRGVGGVGLRFFARTMPTIIAVTIRASTTRRHTPPRIKAGLSLLMAAEPSARPRTSSWHPTKRDQRIHSGHGRLPCRCPTVHKGASAVARAIAAYMSRYATHVTADSRECPQSLRMRLKATAALMTMPPSAWTRSRPANIRVRNSSASSGPRNSTSPRNPWDMFQSQWC